MIDFRRHIRPFFLTPDGTTPTPHKPYYDLASYLATQLTLSFAVLPFIFLSLPDSLTVWQSVYYYGIVGTLSSLVFFASPAKSFFVKSLQKRAVNATAANTKQGRGAQAKDEPETQTLGLPDDPGQDLDEAVQAIKHEMEMRKKRGSLGGVGVPMPSGEELKGIVEERGKRK